MHPEISFVYQATKYSADIEETEIGLPLTHIKGILSIPKFLAGLRTHVDLEISVDDGKPVMCKGTEDYFTTRYQFDTQKIAFRELLECESVVVEFFTMANLDAQIKAAFGLCVEGVSFGEAGELLKDVYSEFKAYRVKSLPVNTMINEEEPNRSSETSPEDA